MDNITPKPNINGSCLSIEMLKSPAKLKNKSFLMVLKKNIVWALCPSSGQPLRFEYR